MRKYYEILKKCPLFDGITEQDLSSLLDCLNVKISHFSKKETILSEGSESVFFGILLSGRAQIERIDYYGNRSILTHIEPSELFAESFAFAGAGSMPVDVVATEDCETLLIDSRRVTGVCSNACSFHRQVIFNLLKIVAAKNIMLNQRAEITAKRTTRDKLLTYLMMHAKKNGSDTFRIPFDRQALADFLEVDRSGLSSEISKLRSEGILESKKNLFKINKEDL